VAVARCLGAHFFGTQCRIIYEAHPISPKPQLMHGESGMGTTVQKVWGMRWDGNKMVEWGGDGTHRDRDSTGGAEMISIPCRSLHTGLWPTQYGRCRKHKERNTDKITVSRECTANKQECYIGKNYKQLRACTAIHN